jgi:branched chain amino acid efflux pump
MLDPGYIVAVLALTFAITFALRAVPFTVLGALRESTIVRELSVWMPVGILGILAVTAFRGTVLALPGTALFAVVAVATTIAVHLLFCRRTLLSLGIGTAVYVTLVNLL